MNMEFGENLESDESGVVCGLDTGRVVATFSHVAEAESFVEHYNNQQLVQQPSVDEEREEIASEHLDDIIVWLKHRGLYDDIDYQDEGPDFPAILTMHENELIAQCDRKQFVSSCNKRNNSKSLSELRDLIDKAMNQAKTEKDVK